MFLLQRQQDKHRNISRKNALGLLMSGTDAKLVFLLFLLLLLVSFFLLFFFSLSFRGFLLLLFLLLFFGFFLVGICMNIPISLS